jgi:hypothetical protein
MVRSLVSYESYYTFVQRDLNLKDYAGGVFGYFI